MARSPTPAGAKMDGLCACHTLGPAWHPGSARAAVRGPRTSQARWEATETHTRSTPAEGPKLRGPQGSPGMPAAEPGRPRAPDPQCTSHTRHGRPALASLTPTPARGPAQGDPGQAGPRLNKSSRNMWGYSDRNRSLGSGRDRSKARGNSCCEMRRRDRTPPYVQLRSRGHFLLLLAACPSFPLHCFLQP